MEAGGGALSGTPCGGEALRGGGGRDTSLPLLLELSVMLLFFTHKQILHLSMFPGVVEFY